ncbi:MFS transporter [Actinomycetospora corticicola]|uniref:DHA2 family multidrug resistance protein-like MFS transporter n=1 Tax=Actinomycetospora corticicola TaxID=663602 RepID=A0A7Y9J7A0_9PSEU|nr:MFS transporter [Actinomycetospora corticicola]NYD37209.1 DHA2 family multidrug resistance protein-like MFS transporter [Actinomycetospora corticicola]
MSRRALALGVLTAPVLLITLDMTVLGAALPAISEDLRPGAATQLWIVDVYSFVLAGLLVVAGSLGDRIGRRRLLLIGTAAFGVASVVAAFAPTAGALVAARALLGLGGATLMPSTLSLIKTVFPEPDSRRRAIGVWAAMFSGGAAAGPVIGGWLLEHFWWGSVFLVNVPVCLALLAVGPVLLPESRDPHPGRFDLLSAGLALATMLPVVYAVKSVATDGITTTGALAAVVGLASGALFVHRQRTLPDPLIDLTLFSHRAFSVSVATNTLCVFALVGLLVLVPQYLQLVVGMSPLTAALWLLPGSLAGMAGALVAARLARRFAVRRLVVGGLTVAAVGWSAIALLAVGAGPVVVVVGMTVAGLAVAMVETLTTDLVLTSAPTDRAGAASAISETGFELGGALGIAVLGSVTAAVYRAGLPDGVPGETLGGSLAAGVDPTVAGPAFTVALAVAGAVAAVAIAYAAWQARLLRPVEATGARESAVARS